MIAVYASALIAILDGDRDAALYAEAIEDFGRAFNNTLKTPVTAQTFRLNVLEAAGSPQIDEMQLDVDQ